MSLSRRSFLASAAGFAALAGPAAAAGAVVNVYSYRQPALIDPLFNAFTAKTGIQVRSIFADNGLIERLAQEGRNSPCDVLLSVDIGRLYDAAQRGLAQPVDSAFIRSHVPASLRDSGNLWFALTMRARVVFAANGRVSDTAMSYEDLADPRWKGRICIRPGNHPYNLGLIGFLIARKGEDWTRTWLKGLKDNLAIKPSGNDRSQAKSVFSGECDLAVANTYYLGVMATNEAEPEQKEWAKAVHIIFPSSPEIGTHVNVSGMLMAKNAPNRDNAVALMEYLASDEAQQLYAAGNFEYPVNPDVAPTALVKSWGSFTPDATNIVEIAKNEAAAARLVDEVQFND